MKYLTQQQIKDFDKAIVRSKNKRDIIAFKLCFRYALRVQELVNITKDDINFESRQIVITGVKNGRTRSYDLDDALYQQIVKYVKQNKITDRLFPVTTTAMQYRFKTQAKNAGISEEYSIHSLRHSCAMMMAQKGSSAIFIQNWLRQKNIASAQVYFEQITDKKVDEAMGKLFPQFM